MTAHMVLWCPMTVWHIRHILCGCLLLLVAVPSYGLSTNRMQASCIYRYSLESWTINEHQVPVEIYRPDRAGTYPIVFMLHGSAGALSVRLGQEPTQDNFGEKSLARACFVVVFPHYLEGIGRKSLASREEMEAAFPQLVEITGALLARAEGLPLIRRKLVLLFGDSLGGYLSVALAFRCSEVAAVSEISGGKPDGYGLVHRHKPRVLISHGADDSLVSLSEAEALAHYCSEHGIPVEKDFYPGEGHYLSPNMEAQVLAKTLKFFRIVCLRRN